MINIYLSILLKKPTLSVCLSVCLSGYAFRSASTHQAETWEGRRVWAPEVQEQLFEVTPSKVKGHPEVNLP